MIVFQKQGNGVTTVLMRDDAELVAIAGGKPFYCHSAYLKAMGFGKDLQESVADLKRDLEKEKAKAYRAFKKAEDRLKELEQATEREVEDGVGPGPVRQIL